MSETVSERYVRLGLRIGRHVEGVVDSYFGPAELPASVNEEPLAEPTSLVTAADELLHELDGGWLRDQVAGLRTYAGVLAGESHSYADEAEGCYGVRPTHTDESVFAAAHDELEQLLPGSGALADRWQRWEESGRIAPERVEPSLAAVIESARASTAALLDLPSGESVTFEIVGGVPWLAYCSYTGDFHSHISVNTELPLSAIELVVLTLHETYPGHHTERACKDELLVRRERLLEESIVLVPTPQSLIAEGIATLAPTVLLAGEAGPAIADALREASGVELDLARALAVERARRPLQWAEVNAALMLHEDGADEAEVHAYLERWTLLGPDVASHIIRFMQEPTSRTYVVTYPAGRELCDAYVAGDPLRFTELVTRQVRVGDLAAGGRAGVAPLDNSQSERPDVTVR
jgi:hypothetical protein